MSENPNNSSHFTQGAVQFDLQIGCEGFEAELNEALDRRQDPSTNARLMGHIEDCADCHQLMDEYVLVDDSMKLLKGEVAEILARTAARSKAQSRLKLISGLSLAMLVLLGCLALLPKILSSQPEAITIAELSNAEMVSVAHPAAEAEPIVKAKPAEVVVSVASEKFEATEKSSSVPMEPVDMDLKAAMSGDINALGQQVDLEPGTWDLITTQFQQLEPVIRYSELPGPMRGTVSITWELIKRTLTLSQNE